MATIKVYYNRFQEEERGCKEKLIVAASSQLTEVTRNCAVIYLRTNKSMEGVRVLSGNLRAFNREKANSAFLETKLIGNKGKSRRSNDNDKRTKITKKKRQLKCEFIQMRMLS